MADNQKTKQLADNEQPAEADSAGQEHNPAIWYFAAIVVLLMAAGIGAYWWRDQQAKQAQQESQQQIEKLEQEVKQLKEADSSQAEETDGTKDSEADSGPNDQDIENIKSAVESGNYAALESLMANPVNFILAATECCGEITPANAVSEMSYASNGTAPWDWNVPEATIDSYRAGFYVDYFPEGVLVGKAANDFIIAFSFSGDGSISQIFMAINEDLLL